MIDEDKNKNKKRETKKNIKAKFLVMLNSFSKNDEKGREGKEKKKKSIIKKIHLK